MTSLVVREVIGGGVLELERCPVTCPACGQQVEAVAADGRVKGYCAVAEQYVDFLITQGIATPMSSQTSTADTRVKPSASAKKRWQDPEYQAKQSAAIKKREQDPEYRAKQSAAHKGRSPSLETRAKISAAAITRWHNTKRGGG